MLFNKSFKILAFADQLHHAVDQGKQGLLKIFFTVALGLIWILLFISKHVNEGQPP